MIEEALLQLDLERYQDVTARLLTGPFALALCCDGQVIASSGDASLKDPLAQWLPGHLAEWMVETTPLCIDVNGQDLVVFGFRAHGEEIVAYFVIAQKTGGGQAGVDITMLLGPLVETMQTELRLADELIVMADELSSRYEELNLVYDTQDQASDYEETQIHLRSLVQNCRDYLDVSFSALILRDKDVLLHDAGKGNRSD